MTNLPQYRTLKEKWIKNFLSSDLVIFPCNLNKSPMISEWNYISQKDSYDLYTYNMNDDIFDENQKNIVEKNIQNNIGLLCGLQSGIVVIDIDFKDGGMTYWKNLLRENNCDDLDTLKVISGSGGIHFYFNWTSDMENWKSKNRIFSTPENKVGIDFRSDNGYVIMPPSIHCDTANLYKFENLSEPCNIKEHIKEMPEWLFNKLNQYFVK